MIRRSAFAVLLALAAFATAQPSSPPPPPATAPATLPDPARAALLLKTVEEVAAELPCLDQGFVADRPPFINVDREKVLALWNRLREAPPALAAMDAPVAAGDPIAVGNGRRILSIDDLEIRALRPGPWSADEIRPLLKHADPKVRTLGIVLLFQLNRADLLPDFADLAYDEKPSFPAPSMSATPISITGPMGAAKYEVGEMQRVSQFARAAISAYAAVSPELKPVLGNRMSVDRQRQLIAEFAKQRHPTLNTGSLKIAMQRATQNQSPVPHERHEQIEAIFRLLDRIEMPRRFFVANQLATEDVRVERASPAYLLEMARQVPRDVRLLAAKGQRPVDDPDLVDFGDRFFSRHVTQLFRAGDADLFLQHELEERQRRGDQPQDDRVARFAVMAARLRPAEADRILADALKRLGTDEYSAGIAREAIAIAMAEIGGEPSLAAALDWFLATPPPGSHGFGREEFLGALAAHPARARMIHERLIRDPRLTAMGPASTRTLIMAVQGYLGRPLATEEEIRSSYVDEAQRTRKFPGLGKWHDALRATVDEWSK